MKKLFIISSVLVLLFSAVSANAQFVRKVLFEEATNASCVPCAQNNPFLKAYLDEKGDSIIAIKYHASFPGVDPMYSHNPTQNAERYSAYYNMNAMPWLNSDGIINDIWPFTIANLNNGFYGRLAIPAPLTVTVTDQRIAGDSIRATVNINLPSNLPSGNYKLRVMAIEKWVIYQTPPGSNGETVFEHVFRRAFPNTAGTTFNGTAGNQQFIFTYKIDPVWKDTSLITIAFIQNDNNKEVLNSGKGSFSTVGINNNNTGIPAAYSLSQNYPNPFNPVTNINFSLPNSSDVKLAVYDMLGQQVALLANGKFDAGSYTIDFDASQLTSGIYFYTLSAGSFKETKKMVIVK
ncbi:MAG: T9SS type A sorting domain-containing protein [Ignavibacteria bacterium]|nr:T9SS type A sorting domain-containing protein [Ignavibacteria bacterium]